MITDKDLPIEKYFDDEEVEVRLTKENTGFIDEYPYIVHFDREEEYIYDFFYRNLNEAKLAFDIICKGV